MIRFLHLACALVCCNLVLHHALAFSSYSEATLERLAQASSLSYLSMDKIPSSPYYKTCNLEPIAQVVDAESESGATIFKTLNGNNNDTTQQQQQTKLIVACRGSANPKNFGTNLKFNLVPATRLSQTTIPEEAMVHEGFQSASVGLWKVLSQQIAEQLADDSSISSSSEIIFTGHSLGAATALLCGVHYKASFCNNNKKGHPPPSIVSFGGPKLCNSILARYIRNDALGGCNILHIVHKKDPVLANNQKLWDSLGFENVGIELECDPNSPRVYFDDTDVPNEKKSLFNFAWNVFDHCNYMGVFVGPRL